MLTRVTFIARAIFSGETGDTSLLECLHAHHFGFQISSTLGTDSLNVGEYLGRKQCTPRYSQWFASIFSSCYVTSLIICYRIRMVAYHLSHVVNPSFSAYKVVVPGPW